MTCTTRLRLVYVYKGLWEDVFSPVPTLSSVLWPRSTSNRAWVSPSLFPQSYPCRLKGLFLIWEPLSLVRTCWTRFVLALSRPWSGLVTLFSLTVRYDRTGHCWLILTIYRLRYNDEAWRSSIAWLIVTSVAYLSDDIIANDVMTRMTRLRLVYVYKGHWEDTYSPVPTLSPVTRPRSTSNRAWFSPSLFPQSYPCRLKGLLLIWALLLLVRTCWTRFVLALSQSWSGLV